MWTEEDQDLVLEHRRIERERCPKCGTKPSDWIDEDGRVKDEPPYQVSAERCLGCEMLDAEQDLIDKDRKYNFGFIRRLVSSWRQDQQQASP